MNRTVYVFLLAAILLLVPSCTSEEAKKKKELMAALESSVGGTVTVKGLAMQSYPGEDGSLKLFGFHAENQYQGESVFWVIASPRQIETERNYSITGTLEKKSGNIEGFDATFPDEVYIITPDTITFLSQYKGPETAARNLLTP
jgi:hypothetical protein